MLARRRFAGCVLCAVTGFIATGTEAQNAPPGLKRTMFTRIDGPMDGYETVNARVDLDAGALVARHTHPGIESSYVVEGALELSVDGQGTRTFGLGRDSRRHRGRRIAARGATAPQLSRSHTSSRRASPSPRQLKCHSARESGADRRAIPLIQLGQAGSRSDADSQCKASRVRVWHRDLFPLTQRSTTPPTSSAIARQGRSTEPSGLRRRTHGAMQA
jgi:hypothetical protein